MYRSFVPLVLAIVCAVNQANAAIVTFSDFSNTSGLVLNGHTAVVNNGIDTGPVLRLTPASTNRSGSAFSQTTLNASNFSSFFQFRITNAGGILDAAGQGGADGLVFVIQPVSSGLGGAGAGLGYAGINPSVAIEFDTWMNAASNGFPGIADPSTNHVGIDVNGSVNSVQTVNISPRFDDSNLWSAWVDYDGTTLEVRLNQTGIRPVAPTMSRAMNISNIIGQPNAFVGFTAGTGGAYGNHDIVQWEYRDTFNPIGAAVPEPSTLAIFGLGGIALAATQFRRRFRTAV
jgi:hypothetical protein